MSPLNFVQKHYAIGITKKDVFLLIKLLQLSNLQKKKILQKSKQTAEENVNKPLPVHKVTQMNILGISVLDNLFGDIHNFHRFSREKPK